MFYRTNAASLKKLPADISCVKVCNQNIHCTHALAFSVDQSIAPNCNMSNYVGIQRSLLDGALWQCFDNILFDS